MGCAVSVETFPDAAELVPQPRIEGGGDSVVEGCVADGNICVSFPGYRAARAVDGQMSSYPAGPCAIAAKNFQSGAPLLEVVARPSAWKHPSWDTGLKNDQRKVKNITTPSLLKNGEGKVVGALCSECSAFSQFGLAGARCYGATPWSETNLQGIGCHGPVC